MDTDKCVLPPIPFVYCFGLQNLRCHMSCRAMKNKRYRGRHTFISVHSQLNQNQGFDRFVRRSVSVDILYTQVATILSEF